MYNIDTGVPRRPNQRVVRVDLRSAVEKCNHGDSFIVATLGEAQFAYIYAKRIGKHAEYRIQGDKTRRVWIFNSAF